jgi:hypothetical protein
MLYLSAKWIATHDTAAAGTLPLWNATTAHEPIPLSQPSSPPPSQNGIEAPATMPITVDTDRTTASTTATATTTNWFETTAQTVSTMFASWSDNNLALPTLSTTAHPNPHPNIHTLHTPHYFYSLEDAFANHTDINIDIDTNSFEQHLSADPLPTVIAWNDDLDGNVEIQCRQTRQRVAVFPKDQVAQVMEHARCNEETALRSLLLHHKNVDYAVLGLIA